MQRIGWLAKLCPAVASALVLAAPASPEQAGTIPITTKSEEARQIYVKGRALAENLRGTDAHALLQQAVAKDPDFALAHLLLATTAPSAKDFFAEMKLATAASGKVSEPERLLILGQDAGLKGDPAAQKEHYTKLLALAPGDQRAQMAVGVYQFGRQDFASAVDHLKQATTIDPGFAPAYNMLGYALRQQGNYAGAEKAFQKYIELIPGDPNPYDSYAELLMKMGRFQESIAQYEKALAKNPNFVASYVGIGTDRVLLGQPDAARAALASLEKDARTNGERRLALFWTAASYLHEGAHDKALATLGEMRAIAEKDGDKAAVSGDLNLMGNVLLDAGRTDAALARFAECVEVIEAANVPAEVKQAARRNLLFDEARVALARKDVATAQAKLEAYGQAVAEHNVPFELRQQHELAGLVALQQGDAKAAVSELSQANQQDPRVLYELGLAYRAAGDKARAEQSFRSAADFNGLSFNYGYVRNKAQQALAAS
jgi:tetratricopeptide (TPR) repeat protein